MSDKFWGKSLDKRTMFGIDFLRIMNEIKSWENHQVNEKYQEITNFVTLLFLAEWGYTREEFLEIMYTFNSLYDSWTAEKRSTTIKRMSKYLSDDVKGQEKLIAQINAIVTFNYGLFDHQRDWTDEFQLYFKLPEEVYELQLHIGNHWVVRIEEIGLHYLRSGINANELENKIRDLKI